MPTETANGGSSEGRAIWVSSSTDQRRLFFLLFQNPLREGDHEHLAGRLLQHVLDRGREETGLAPPFRRRAEHDQIDAELLAWVTIASPIERARTVFPLTS